MQESPLSQASLVRQVAREGARWRLAPEVDPKDGRVRVCEIVATSQTAQGLGTINREPSRRICTVNEEAPFTEALRNRIDNGETDLARRYRLADEQEAAEQRRLEAEREAETLRIWKSRKKIIALPTGIIPAGLAERRRAR